jgi:hypothetical protein
LKKMGAAREDSRRRFEREMRSKLAKKNQIIQELRVLLPDGGPRIFPTDSPAL